MSKRTVHAIAFLLLMMVTPSAIGVPLFSHICNLSGHKDISLIPVSECCPEEKESSPVHAMEQAPCCSDEVAIVKAEIPAVSKTFKPVIEPMAILVSFAPHLITEPLSQKVSINVLPNPPPRSGIDILHSISILRI